MKILVLNDELEILTTMSRCFSIGWPDAEKLTASDARSGLDIFEKERPDIVIIDIVLPDINGIEVCGILRQKSKVPIIMLTGRMQETDIVRCFEKGADDYIIKPFGHSELMARIKAVLWRYQSMMPSYELGVDVFLNARHYVTNGSQGPTHCHSWRIQARLAGNPIADHNTLIGFADAKKIVQNKLNRYNDTLLNQIAPFDKIMPTTENIAAVFYEEVNGAFSNPELRLSSICVWESPTNYVLYRGNGH